MDNVFSRVMQFFYPVAEVPEEEERLREAVKYRKAARDQLREQLATNPSLEEKIDKVTAEILRSTIPE